MTATVFCIAALTLAVASTGCSGEADPPSSLSDGSRARPPPVELEDADGPTVATRVRLTGVPMATCAGTDGAPGRASVERVDVRGGSVTYLDRSGTAVYGCDAVGARTTTRTSSRSWCGHAFDRLVDGRLRDPRLSLSCKDSDGDVVGFAWIQPLADTAYVVVAHSGYNEAYSVAARMPVRVASDDVDVAASRATFAISEHARDGRRLRSYELEASVSG